MNESWRAEVREARQYKAHAVCRPSLDKKRVLEQYGEHGEQAQRSNGGPIACFGRQVVRKAG